MTSNSVGLVYSVLGGNSEEMLLYADASSVPTPRWLEYKPTRCRISFPQNKRSEVDDILINECFQRYKVTGIIQVLSSYPFFFLYPYRHAYTTTGTIIRAATC